MLWKYLIKCAFNLKANNLNQLTLQSMNKLLCVMIQLPRAIYLVIF